jgi:hypothetical protein
MNNPLRSILKVRHAGAAALAVAAVAAVASPASAAPVSRSHHGKHATPAQAVSTQAAATPAAAPAAAPTFTSVISIGGYVFYNLTYAEAVDAYFAAVAAAPAGYTPPPVYSVSVNTTVSGTVEDGN